MNYVCECFDIIVKILHQLRPNLLTNGFKKTQNRIGGKSFVAKHDHGFEMHGISTKVIEKT